MPRKWFFRRLATQPREGHRNRAVRVLPVVHDLVGYLRSADVGARWSFQRLGDAAGPQLDSQIDLGFRTTDDIGRELDRRLRLAAAHHEFEVVANHHRRPDDDERLSDAAAEFADELAAASSDLALDLVRDAELAGDRQLALAISHFRELTDLIPDSERASFLFTYWQHRTRAMAPEARIELSRRADRQGGEIFLAASESRLEADQEAAWHRYLAQLRAGTAERRAAGIEPMNYLLFDHARRCHNRLGIGVTAEALAARVVRVALSTANVTVQPQLAPVPA